MPGIASSRTDCYPFGNARNAFAARRPGLSYSKELDSKIEAITANWKTASKKMFGGTCRLLHGNMMCGVYKNYLILRLGETEAAQALRQAHVKGMDITGKVMKGWVMLAETDLGDHDLEKWLEKAYLFAQSLPPKQA